MPQLRAGSAETDGATAICDGGVQPCQWRERHPQRARIQQHHRRPAPPQRVRPAAPSAPAPPQNRPSGASPAAPLPPRWGRTAVPTATSPRRAGQFTAPPPLQAPARRRRGRAASLMLNFATATGQNSIATGDFATATGQGSVANGITSPPATESNVPWPRCQRRTGDGPRAVFAFGLPMRRRQARAASPPAQGAASAFGMNSNATGANTTAIGQASVASAIGATAPRHGSAGRSAVGALGDRRRGASDWSQLGGDRCRLRGHGREHALSFGTPGNEAAADQRGGGRKPDRRGQRQPALGSHLRLPVPAQFDAIVRSPTNRAEARRG